MDHWNSLHRVCLNQFILHRWFIVCWKILSYWFFIEFLRGIRVFWRRYFNRDFRMVIQRRLLFFDYMIFFSILLFLIFIEIEFSSLLLRRSVLNCKPSFRRCFSIPQATTHYLFAETFFMFAPQCEAFRALHLTVGKVVLTVQVSKLRGITSFFTLCLLLNKDKNVGN